jgi:hypothetical protein
MISERPVRLSDNVGDSVSKAVARGLYAIATRVPTFEHIRLVSNSWSMRGDTFSLLVTKSPDSAMCDETVALSLRV